METKVPLGLLTAFALMSSSSMYAENSNDLRPEDIDTTPKKPPVPKGCQEYFFNKNRGYNTKQDGYTVFYCIAVSLKSAFKKFDKCLSKQSAV